MVCVGDVSNPLIMTCSPGFLNITRPLAGSTRVRQPAIRKNVSGAALDRALWPVQESTMLRQDAYFSQVRPLNASLTSRRVPTPLRKASTRALSPCLKALGRPGEREHDDTRPPAPGASRQRSRSVDTRRRRGKTTGSVVEKPLDHRQLHAEPCQSGRKGASAIVHSPRRDRCSAVEVRDDSVKLALGLAITADRIPAVHRKDKTVVRDTWQAGYDRSRPWGAGSCAQRRS